MSILKRLWSTSNNALSSSGIVNTICRWGTAKSLLANSSAHWSTYFLPHYGQMRLLHAKGTVLVVLHSKHLYVRKPYLGSRQWSIFSTSSILYCERFGFNTLNCSQFCVTWFLVKIIVYKAENYSSNFVTHYLLCFITTVFCTLILIFVPLLYQ